MERAKNYPLWPVQRVLPWHNHGGIHRQRKSQSHTVHPWSSSNQPPPRVNCRPFPAAKINIEQTHILIRTTHQQKKQLIQPHLSTGGIGLTAIINGIFDARCFQRVRQCLHRSDLHQDRIGDDQGLLMAQGFDLTHSTFHGTLAHDGLAGHEEGLTVISRGAMMII